MSIPASAIVNITPGVLGAGGNPLSLNGLLLSTSAVLPNGIPTAFYDSATVGTYFGNTSQEYAMAQTYFAGFENSTTKPGTLYFVRYAKVAIAGWVRGAASTLTLTQVQAIIPGVTTSSASIAATTLTVGAMTSGAIYAGMLLSGAGVSVGTRIVAQLTGTPGGAGTYSVDLTQTVAGPIVATAAYDLTITVNGGAPTVVASLNLSASTSLSDAAARVATAVTAVIGTYLSNFASFVLTSNTTGASSSVSVATGAGATALGLTAALGAIASPGSAVSVPSSVMDAAVIANSNWATFSHAFEPDSSSTVYTVKQALATWTSATNGRFMYVALDYNALAVAANVSTLTLGQSIKDNSLSGTAPIYCSTSLDPSGLGAAFVLGAVAAIDFAATNGRVVLHGKRGSGVPFSVSDLTSFNNLTTNHYSGYSSFATANDIFNWFANGFVSGDEAYIDNYVNAIYLNSQFQLALMTLMGNTPSIPCNDIGATFIKGGMQAPIDEALNFGSIRKNVPLSSAQSATVNAAAGLPIANILSTRGYYLKVPIPTAQVRNNRGPWPITFWYTNGEGIQKINVASINVR